MSTPQADLPATPGRDDEPSPKQALRQLFLTLFLRGRSARGMQRSTAPQSVATKLSLTLLMYALIGCMAFYIQPQHVFTLSAYLHALTFAFLGMFIASSAGEILFNKEEADILLHRPIDPRTLLWAKVRVLIEVSLWLAVAFNLAGFFVGIGLPDSSFLFLPAHALSIVLEALFCTSTIVVAYQLCLRWCGRERLENLMTGAQIVVSVGAVLASQIVPRLMFRGDGQVLTEAEQSWWLAAVPPAWFAGIDEALCAGLSLHSCLFALAALVATALVSWLALGRLAGDYDKELMAVNETAAKRPSKAGRRRLERIIDSPPICWLLGDPVARASFLLTAAYLVRDRDVKLRVYPGLAPVLVMPVAMLLPMAGQGHMAGFAAAMCGAYVGLTPMMALAMLQYSQQWQASDVFRCAPMIGPAPICAGARQAVIWLLAVPAMLLLGSLVMLLGGNVAELPLFLSGLIPMPLYLLIPNRGGRGIPLSLPVDEAKATGRGLSLAGVTILAVLLAGVASFCWTAGYFWPLIGAETLVASTLYITIRRRLKRAPWPSAE